MTAIRNFDNVKKSVVYTLSGIKYLIVTLSEMDIIYNYNKRITAINIVTLPIAAKNEPIGYILKILVSFK
jgi:hypothetical protein